MADLINALEELSCKVPPMTTLVTEDAGHGIFHSKSVEVDPLDIANWLIKNREFVTEWVGNRVLVCNSCDWVGDGCDAVALGVIGPLCPECHETTTAVIEEKKA